MPLIYKSGKLNEPFSFNLYQNPVSKGKRKFLSSENGKGFNKSRDQKELAKYLGDSLRYIFHIMSEPHNLKKQQIHQIFNSNTISNILVNLLLQIDEQHRNYASYEYDFRTSELARSIFLVSVTYLLKSKQFQDDPYVKENIKRISQDFKILSRSLLEKEDDTLTFSKERQREFQEEIWKLEGEESGYDQAIPPPEFFDEHYSRMLQIVDNLRTKLIDLNLEYDDLKINKRGIDKIKMKKNREEYYKFMKIKKQHEPFNEKLLEGHKKMVKLYDALNMKYHHINYYFSNLDPLKENPNDTRKSYGDLTEEQRVEYRKSIQAENIVNSLIHNP